jgi:hypothetical protein
MKLLTLSPPMPTLDPIHLFSAHFFLSAERAEKKLTEKKGQKVFFL